jgi:hypothetical protein
MRYSALLLTSMLALACTPDSPTTPSGPTSSAAGNFASAAAEVDRGPFTQWVSFADFEETIVIGGTVEELAALCATGDLGSLRPLWDDLSVTRGQNDKLHFTDRGRDLPVVVYQASDHDFCAGTLPAFATGTVNVVFTSSDWFNDGPGVHAFGLTANGTVTTPTGDTYRPHAVGRFVLDDPALPPVAEHFVVTLRALK